jgi:hypothetical protein
MLFIFYYVIMIISNNKNNKKTIHRKCSWSLSQPYASAALEEFCEEEEEERLAIATKNNTHQTIQFGLFTAIIS